MKFPNFRVSMEGYDPIPAAEVDEIIASVFDAPLTILGFEKINRRKWVRSGKPEIREVFSILAMKGASYSPAWGFSLDYVPHVSGSKLKWHRTNKSAILDFRFAPFDYESPGSVGFEQWIIDSLYGYDRAVKQAKQVAKLSLQKAQAFWNSVEDLRDVSSIYEDQLRQTRAKDKKIKRFGFFNYTQHPIAYAFTLAKLGKEQEAVDILEESIQRGISAKKVENELRQRLNAIFNLNNI